MCFYGKTHSVSDLHEVTKVLVYFVLIYKKKLFNLEPCLHTKYNYR